MTDAWLAGTIVAVVAGIVGFHVVLRGSAFAAHALPNGAFAGAAGASLVGLNPIAGMAVFSLAGAMSIAALGRRARHGVATALVIVAMLGTGALFLSMTTEYAPQIYALLFGQILGVSGYELAPMTAIGLAAVAACLGCHRLLVSSAVLPESSAAAGLDSRVADAVFLAVLALATTMAVPVVGALLIFTLLVAPAAAAFVLASSPPRAMALSVAISLLVVWLALFLSYEADLPIGFFVGVLSAVAYLAARSFKWAFALGRPRR